MHFTDLVILQTLVTCMVTFSPEMGAHAGYPAEQFNELNNKNQRNLGRKEKIFKSTTKGGKADKENSSNGKKSDESSENGFMPLAAEGEVTLLVRTTSKEGEEKACMKGRNGKAEIYMDELHLLAINVPKQDVKATIDELSKQSGIESVEVDQEMHALPAFHEKNDDSATSSRGLRSGTRKLAETVPYGIDMVKAQNVITKGQGMSLSPRKICVVDTGYALGHPDLPNNPDHDVTGFSPYGDGELWNVDGNSHGTHCAGTIGAVNNDIGVVGVNPDPTKFSFHIGKGLTNSGSGSNAGVMSAVNSCVEAGAHVISMSLGGGGASSANANTYKEIYEEKGVLIIAAAGNSGNSALSYPASYPHIMSVAAVDSNENRASFSQYNSQVEIAGPGVNVQSTIPNNNGYASYSGTSMATPHVAGVAALVWSYFPQCTNHQIRGALIKSARDKGASGCDSQYGHGIVDAEAAFDLLNNNGCEAGDNASGPSPGGCAQAAGPTPAPTPCTGTTLTLDLVTDNYGGETSWDIRDSADNILHSGSGYNSATEYTENWCKTLPGCATFTIRDSYGDGVCCGYGSGSYSLTYDGTIIKSGGEFGSSESTEFGCTSQTPEPTPNPTPSPTSAPTPAPTPAGCHVSCATDPLPWASAPGISNKCDMFNCKDCAQCTVLTCIQGCYDLDPLTSGKCDWEDCAGCLDCV